jgi:hypothetical protein
MDPFCAGVLLLREEQMVIGRTAGTEAEGRHISQSIIIVLTALLKIPKHPATRMKRAPRLLFLINLNLIVQ